LNNLFLATQILFYQEGQIPPRLKGHIVPLQGRISRSSQVLLMNEFAQDVAKSASAKEASPVGKQSRDQQ
jgi:hypothetical protein